MKKPRALVDACLLVKGNVSNVLFDLAQSNLITLHWTPEIAEEFVRNWTKRRLYAAVKVANSQKTSNISQIDFEKLARRRLKMFTLMQKEWALPGWDFEKAQKIFPKSEFRVGEPGGVDAKDYHVAIAAAHLATAFPMDEVWLITENTSDLPSDVLKKHMVWSIDQAVALEVLYESHRTEVTESIEKTINETNRPKLTKMDMINIVLSRGGFASEKVSTALKNKWEIQTNKIDEIEGSRKEEEGHSDLS